MKFPYSFSVLRYRHDATTGEFLNVGIALYSREAGFLRAICSTKYERITQLFTQIDGNKFRSVVRFVQEHINSMGEDLPSELPFEPGLAISALLARVLPPDDSSLQFSDAGVGLSNDLEATLLELFERYVQQYEKENYTRREDEDVWKVFREPLVRRRVSDRLVPKKIAARNYEYEFQHSWKNEVWHVCEPISFDLVQPSSILDKANRWLGRAMSLAEGQERFQMYVLLGEPCDRSLKNTFGKAKNILQKMPIQTKFISETEAEEFADDVARQIREHD